VPKSEAPGAPIFVLGLDVQKSTRATRHASLLTLKGHG